MYRHFTPQLKTRAQESKGGGALTRKWWASTFLPRHGAQLRYFTKYGTTWWLKSSLQKFCTLQKTPPFRGRTEAPKLGDQCKNIKIGGATDQPTQDNKIIIYNFNICNIKYKCQIADEKGNERIQKQ